jgi:hypothetical protein
MAYGTPPPKLPNPEDQSPSWKVEIDGVGNLTQDDDNTLSEVTVTATQTRTDVSGNLTATDEITPQPNVLDRFASYTYSASVYLMSTLQYERLLRRKKKDINGYFLLFQSGGAPTNRGGFLGKGSGEVGGQNPGTEGLDAEGVDDFGRNPAFPQDFYIDSITVDNALPGKATQTAHMVTDLKFTVIEPGNITLLDRLYRAVQDAGQVQEENQPINYTAAAYLMVIRWYGYDINGNLLAVGAADPNTGLTDPNAVVEKFIPFLIKKIDWSVSSKLVTYEFDCAPVGQIVAGGTRRGTVPYDTQFTASSVSALLGDGLQYTAGTAPNASPGNSTTTGGVFSRPDFSTQAVSGSTAQPPPPKASAAPSSKLVIKQGLMGAMNAYQQELVKKGIYDVADTYAIEFSGGIGDATLILPGRIKQSDDGPMGPPDPNQALDPEKNPVDISNRNYSITAGMQLVQAIDLVIRNSSYILSQQLTVIDAKTQIETPNLNALNKPMVWYEISFEATQGKYDPKRRDYAYDILFIVTPYPLQNFESRYFPLTRFRGVHKSYPYWFTGANTAVLDFTANFNSLYNLTVTGTTAKDNIAAAQRETSTASMREIAKYTYMAASSESRQGEQGRALEVQANAAEYLYSPSNMGTTKMRIIGDPAWIQQGSISGGVNAREFSFSPFFPDGTINFDSEQVMFEISWQRPKDYDINTGLADPYAGGNNKDRLPIQSTVYQATRVISEFRQGKFEQTIEGSLFMFPKPDGTNTVGKSTGQTTAQNTNQRTDNTTDVVDSTRSNAQSPTVAQNFVTNTNTSVVNSITNGAALSSTGTRPATAPPPTNIVASTTPPAAVNSNSTVGPASYPRASTGTGVVAIKTTESAPQPLNVNPFITAGRTQTIVRES